MKSKSDPRHVRRIKNFQAVFAWDCGNHTLFSQDSEKIIETIGKIDEMIGKYAPKWPIDKINKVDLSILRCAIWELVFQKITPPKVIIDEAVEIAKEFGTDNSSSFINGVIGSIIENSKIITTDDKKN